MSDDQMRTDAADEPFQFRLSTLLVLPVFVAVFFATAQLLDPCMAVALMIPAVLVVVGFRRRTSIWDILPLTVVLVVIGGVFLGFIVSDMSPEPARRSQCCNNLKQIGLALHNYHDRYHSFPPAYVADVTGRPIHSWRVLLLPFLEQERLYDCYRFDEPWDGPHNIQLVKDMPAVFRCPSDQTREGTCTSYVAVIGPETAWPGERTVSFSDIVDGTSNTWLVVEVADSGIAWSEPRDLHVLQMAPEINAPAGQGVSSKHPGGAQVLFADGSVRFMAGADSPQPGLDPKTIHDALTISGGEPPPQDW